MYIFLFIIFLFENNFIFIFPSTTANASWNHLLILRSSERFRAICSGLYDCFETLSTATNRKSCGCGSQQENQSDPKYHSGQGVTTSQEVGTTHSGFVWLLRAKNHKFFKFISGWPNFSGLTQLVFSRSIFTFRSQKPSFSGFLSKHLHI